MSPHQSIDRFVTIASAIIRNTDGKILMLQRGATGTFENHWQLPEGKIEKDEYPLLALQREVHEEIGQITSTTEFRCVSHNTLQAHGLTYLCIRLVFNVQTVSETVSLSDEHIAYKWVSLGEMKTLSLVPGIESALAMAQT